MVCMQQARLVSSGGLISHASLQHSAGGRAAQLVLQQTRINLAKAASTAGAAQPARQLLPLKTFTFKVHQVQLVIQTKQMTNRSAQLPDTYKDHSLISCLE